MTEVSSISILVFRQFEMRGTCNLGDLKVDHLENLRAILGLYCSAMIIF